MLDVLLVDDNPGDAYLVREAFASGDAQIRIDVAPSLAEALDKLGTGHFDGVLLDLNLPDSVGYGTLRRLRDAAPRLPVIVLSGAPDMDCYADALRSDALEVIHKDECRQRFFSFAVSHLLERHIESERQREIAQLVEATPDAMLVVSDSGVVRYVNVAAAQLFGYTAAELVGQLLDFSVAPGATTELTIFPRGGEPRVGEARVMDIRWHGEPSHLATVRDVTERKLAEELRARAERLEREGQIKAGFVAELERANSHLAAQNEALEQSKRAAEILVKEIHHRVKNNLQVVSSMLHLQASGIEDPELLAVFRKSCLRVDAIAKAHEHLYKVQELGLVKMENYLHTVVEQLRGVWCAIDGGVETTYSLLPLSLPIDLAIPCGLIVNELVTNALKHAFPNRRGTVMVSLDVDDDGWVELMVADDGVGLPAHLRQGSFGFVIVAAFAEQLGGRWETTNDQGTAVHVRFPVRGPATASFSPGERAAAARNAVGGRESDGASSTKELPTSSFAEHGRAVAGGILDTSVFGPLDGSGRR